MNELYYATFLNLFHGITKEEFPQALRNARRREDFVIGFRELNRYTDCEIRIIGNLLLKGRHR